MIKNILLLAHKHSMVWNATFISSELMHHGFLWCEKFETIHARIVEAVPMLASDDFWTLVLTIATIGSVIEAIEVGREMVKRVTSVNVVEFVCRLRWPRIMRLRWKSGVERPRPWAV